MHAEGGRHDDTSDIWLFDRVFLPAPPGAGGAHLPEAEIIINAFVSLIDDLRTGSHSVGPSALRRRWL